MNVSDRAPDDNEPAATGLPESVPPGPQPAVPPPGPPGRTALAAAALLVLALAWSAAIVSASAPRAQPDLLGLAVHSLVTLSVFAVTVAFFHYRANAAIPPLVVVAGVLFLLADLTDTLQTLVVQPAWMEHTYAAGAFTLLATAAVLAGLLQWMLRSRTAFYRQIRLNRRLGALNRMMRALSTTPDPRAISRAVLEQALHALRAQAGTVLLVDRATGELEFVATEGPQSESLAGLRLSPGTGIVGWVARQGRAVRVANAQADSRFYAGVDRLTGQTTRSVLAVPIRARDETLGVIELINRRPSDQPRRAWTEFSDDDLAFMDVLARSAAAALENAHLYAELQDADRARRELVANVAHELRAPLTFLKAHAELLAAGELGPLTDEQRGSLDVIKRKSDALAGLAADVVALERAGSVPLAMAPLDLGRLAADAVTAAGPAPARAGIALDLDVAQPVPPVPGDELRLTEVFDNLLSNALKFTPAGGRVTLAVEDAGANVRASVRDTGRGIPAEHCAHIFERFYLATGPARRTAGTGLGLAICRAIVRAHGGEIGLESEEGKGSTFYFTIPKAVP